MIASVTGVATAAGTVGATVLALVGIYRTWWMRPRLSMRMQIYDPPNVDLIDNPVYFTNAEENISDERVEAGDWRRSGRIRARVSAARSAALSAEVVLLGAHLTDDEGKRAIALDGMSLRWTGEPFRTQLTVPPGLPRHVDIAFVVQRLDQPRVPLIVNTDHRLNDLRHKVAHGVLCLDLVLASENGPPSYYQLVLEYDGMWPADELLWRHLRVLRCTKRRRLVSRGSLHGP
jgi:hypothetical protein